MTLPLASKEGFIRQVLGWREFVHHVDRETNGFRLFLGKTAKPGDAGYRKWVSPK